MELLTLISGNFDAPWDEISYSTSFEGSWTLNLAQPWQYFYIVQQCLEKYPNYFIKSESKKRAHIQKLVVSKKSSFFVQSLWNLVKIITSWVNHFHMRVGKNVNFYYWPIFERVFFFIPQTWLRKFCQYLVEDEVIKSHYLRKRCHLYIIICRHVNLL